MNALAFDRVSREFRAPDGRSYTAVEDVSFDVAAGSFVALVGPSGCGKSTLLNLAAGLLTPSSGRVHVNGERLSGLNRRATYMFQQDALLPWKSVRDNVALGLTLAGVGPAAAEPRAAAWLERVGLGGFAAHYPSQLSGGMRKRVAMAQNWIIDRDLLLMDEPFSALDVHTRQRMESELLGLWEDRSAESLARRKTILFVTHDLEEAIALADEVVVLSAGPASRIVARHAVTLDRPRDVLELRTTTAFVDLYKSLWSVLREEVIKSQRAWDGTRG
jgi:NitT/TauT family transport system ATP-binding protein